MAYLIMAYGDVVSKRESRRLSDPYRHRHALADMCIDMCVDMCIDACINMCTDMCIDMCINMCTEVCINICKDVRSKHVHMHCRLQPLEVLLLKWCPL